jgi:hypothetical protein
MLNTMNRNNARLENNFGSMDFNKQQQHATGLRNAHSISGGGYSPSSPRNRLGDLPSSTYDSPAARPAAAQRLSPRPRGTDHSPNPAADSKNFYENLFHTKYSNDPFRDSAAARNHADKNPPKTNDLNSILFGGDKQPHADRLKNEPSTRHHNNQFDDEHLHQSRRHEDRHHNYDENSNHHNIDDDFNPPRRPGHHQQNDEDRMVVVHNETNQQLQQPRGVNKSYLMKMKRKYKYRVSANVAGTKFDIVKETLEAIGCKILPDENFDRYVFFAFFFFNLAQIRRFCFCYMPQVP